MLQTTTDNLVFLLHIQKKNVSVRAGVGVSNLKTLTPNIDAFIEITRNWEAWLGSMLLTNPNAFALYDMGNRTGASSKLHKQ